MSRIVVDAAVGLKWVVAEAGSPHACALAEHELLAPESILLDWGDALAAKRDRGELTAAEARERLDALLRAPLALIPIRGLAAAAQEIAATVPASMREAAYLALAVVDGCRLVSADRDLVDRVAASRWQSHIALLGSEASSWAPGAR